jgi:hypothetical protein
MPTPVPYDTSLATPFWTFNDSVRGGGPNFDQQRYETIGSDQTDSKLLHGENILWYRYIAGLGETPSLWWAELSGHPDYWLQVPWGQEYQLGSPGGSGSSWSMSPVVGTYGRLTAVDEWVQGGFPGFSSPVYAHSLRAFQVICPQLWTPKSYEIWNVTGRWSTTSGFGAGYDSTGVFPTPYPWSSSTDFVMIGSGTLNPGDTLIVGPPNFNPTGTSQAPPAPTIDPSPAGTAYPPGSDWDGWGVASFLIFL